MQSMSKFDAQKTCGTRTASARIAIIMQYFDAEICTAMPIFLGLSYISGHRNIFDGTRIANNPFYNCIQCVYRVIKG
jgi:hypothetical protein